MCNVDLCLEQNWFILISFSTAASARDNNLLTDLILVFRNYAHDFGPLDPANQGPGTVLMALWSFCPQITLSLTHWSQYTCFSPCQRNSNRPAQPAGSYLWLLCIELNHVHLNNYIKNIFYIMAISIKTCKEFIILSLSWLIKSAICQYYELFKRWDFICKENQWHIITWVMMWQSTN